MPKLTLEAAIQVVKVLVEFIPTKAVEAGYGDYNDNGTPDVILRLIRKDGDPIILGPIDVPLADVGQMLEAVGDLMGG